MFDGSSANEHGNDTPSASPHPNDFPASEHGKETSSVSPNDNMFPKAALQKSNTPPSALRQNLFMVFITLTQLVQTIPLGAGINSGLAIGEALGATHIESVWIVASYPLTQGAFVLIGGRLGAVYGHKSIFSAGCVWWVLWALCGRFSNNLVSMCIMKGLCGIGGGLMIPNIVALLGITLLVYEGQKEHMHVSGEVEVTNQIDDSRSTVLYFQHTFPPGRKRNLGLALFGAMAPVGTAGGSLVSTVIVQLSEWKWLFFMLGLLGFVVYGTAMVIVPGDEPVDPNGEVDWIGAYLGVGALILFNFVWKWDSPYEIALLILAVIHFAGFAYWEAKVAKEPILRFNNWKAPSFGILVLAIFFSFMRLGIFFWYMNIYMQTIRGDSLIMVGVQFLPLTIVGCANAFFAAWLVPRVPAQVIIGMGCLAMTTINVLLATISAELIYWGMAFPAMFLSAFTIDLITTSAQMIASNTVPMKHQGVAGSLVGTLLSYGMTTVWTGLVPAYLEGPDYVSLVIA